MLDGEAFFLYAKMGRFLVNRSVMVSLLFSFMVDQVVNFSILLHVLPLAGKFQRSNRMGAVY
ncbi:hypothetical protein [Sutcliffiella rhizosphaerae]|uniref:hypothetical protein n=1 Tax=Sutcliffiella rhizosphaerae TaxID=2880967 RepID=UPI001E4523A3|nr:hypothetical protein [Sutcliffiella rhizosphaerae]